MSKKLALYGAGGHASEVIAQLSYKFKSIKLFVDDKYVTNDFQPIGSFNPEEYAIMIPVSDSVAREKMVNKLPSGTSFWSFIHPTALLMDDATIKITDIEGNLVFEAIAQGGTLEWDTTAFGKYQVSSGVYMVFISSKDAAQTTVKKVMIIR